MSKTYRGLCRNWTSIRDQVNVDATTEATRASVVAKLDAGIRDLDIEKNRLEDSVLTVTVDGTAVAVAAAPSIYPKPSEAVRERPLSESELDQQVRITVERNPSLTPDDVRKKIKQGRPLVDVVA